MSFLSYLQDKRYFLLMYAVTMMFVSLIMLVSMKGHGALNNLAYMNGGCFLFAAGYLVWGYFYRKSFYQELQAFLQPKSEGDPVRGKTPWVNPYQDWAIEALPAPQNAEQELYLELLRQLAIEQTKEKQLLHADLKNHQDFILSWIHDVKLPIAASQLIMQNRAGKTAEYLVDKLEDELSKIDSYVEQALYYSRIDAFSRDYFITEVPLLAIVKETVKKSAKVFIAKRIRPDMEGLTHSVNSDSKWLGYIVNQIVANALTYTENGGSITFRSEDTATEKRLIIADTGIGIVAGDLPRVFDKGFTGVNGRTNNRSTGMGLYLAKQLAIKLGHDLSITSTEGEGTAVTVHFMKVRHYNDFR
ncbi:sensor histidine kinase [Paenibacillus roseipurpureus]|uniref:histidine kinase n=1 Tax=Paenibacillus roseopurpureus TaxID=2918901 RepID=A0AA96RK95_9BACL|nr:sensor histidine kinase [Paenibacillus sp. MBLB1832]WNR44119.1 sensor histidine kinase [Paenibacillus sp. MBLB1832]